MESVIYFLPILPYLVPMSIPAASNALMPKGSYDITTLQQSLECVGLPIARVVALQESIRAKEFNPENPDERLRKVVEVVSGIRERLRTEGLLYEEVFKSIAMLSELEKHPDISVAQRETVRLLIEALEISLWSRETYLQKENGHGVEETTQTVEVAGGQAEFNAQEWMDRYAFYRQNDADLDGLSNFWVVVKVLKELLKNISDCTGGKKAAMADLSKTDSDLDRLLKYLVAQSLLNSLIQKDPSDSPDPVALETEMQALINNVAKFVTEKDSAVLNAAFAELWMIWSDILIELLDNFGQLKTVLEVWNRYRPKQNPATVQSGGVAPKKAAKVEYPAAVTEQVIPAEKPRMQLFKDQQDRPWIPGFSPSSSRKISNLRIITEWPVLYKQLVSLLKQYSELLAELHIPKINKHVSSFMNEFVTMVDYLDKHASSRGKNWQLIYRQQGNESFREKCDAELLQEVESIENLYYRLNLLNYYANEYTFLGDVCGKKLSAANFKYIRMARKWLKALPNTPSDAVQARLTFDVFRNFSGWYLNGQNFNDVSLNGCDLSAAHMQKSNLVGADIINANFAHADLRDARLSRLYLKLRDRYYTKEGYLLETRDLGLRYMKCCNIIHANFCYADLRNAKLMGCEFKKTAMVGTNFLGADFGNPARKSDYS